MDGATNLLASEFLAAVADNVDASNSDVVGSVVLVVCNPTCCTGSQMILVSFEIFVAIAV